VGGTDIKRTCAGSGQNYTDEQCPLGCVPNGGAHCGVFHPAGGTVMASDLVGQMSELVMTANGSATVIDANTRKIGATVWPDSRTDLTTHATVFWFKDLTIKTPIQLIGNNAVILVASNDIVIDALIEGRPIGCSGTAVQVAGPGGFNGGAAGLSAIGSGGGTGGGNDQTQGGGGGGFGGVGGAGGSGSPPGPAGGTMYGDPAIPMLFGGGGGGGGGNGASPIGGGGGAAIQLVALGKITINGGINAGGCGGKNGAANDAGGGGGAGGTILLEGLQIAITGKLAVNGGGGGGGGGGSPGAAGLLDRAPAGGGSGGAGNAPGGAGGALNLVDGSPGTFNSGTSRSGGGGGAVGRIRITTFSGSASVDVAAVLSPALGDTPTTCTQDQLDIQ
jgi:hypothetical protein